jgi:hypothetical protein
MPPAGSTHPTETERLTLSDFALWPRAVVASMGRANPIPRSSAVFCTRSARTICRLELDTRHGHPTLGDRRVQRHAVRGIYADHRCVRDRHLLARLAAQWRHLHEDWLVGLPLAPGIIDLSLTITRALRPKKEVEPMWFDLVVGLGLFAH